jgi:phospholipid/cholesterol/gamma-HCH transport system permease protein
MAVDANSTGARIALGRLASGDGCLRLSGEWKLRSGLPTPAAFRELLGSQGRLQRIVVDASGLDKWDSGLLAFLVGVWETCRARNVDFDPGNLPTGARRLLALATAVPERQGAHRTAAHHDFLTLVGDETLKLWRTFGGMLTFIGQATESFGKLIVLRARFRRTDFVEVVFACGAAALPIVTLISFLVGLILAFVGAIQLQQFGAQIYVADLVGVAMAREMGALMTAIIMSGRTGAAFAAQLGTMQVNEEIDALSTFGFSPMEFLVLPRMLALILMMPLLCIYADAMGILGGAVVGVGMLGLSVTQYVNETLHGVGLLDFAIGIIKSSVFGVIVALSGCMHGIQAGRSASAVGLAATSAVVTSIVLIIVTDGIFAVLTNVLGL